MDLLVKLVPEDDLDLADLVEPSVNVVNEEDPENLENRDSAVLLD